MRTRVSHIPWSPGREKGKVQVGQQTRGLGTGATAGPGTGGCPGVAQGKAEDSHLKWGWGGARGGCPGHLNPFRGLRGSWVLNSSSSCSNGVSIFGVHTQRGRWVHFTNVVSTSLHLFHVSPVSQGFRLMLLLGLNSCWSSSVGSTDSHLMGWPE